MVSFRAGVAENLNVTTARGVRPKGACHLWLCWIGLLLVLSDGARSQAAESDPLVSAWLAAQTNIQTWAADFVQTRNFKSLTQPLMATGRVWFAAPNRFRWELSQPPRTIAVRATDELLVIYPRLKRAERYRLTEGQTGEWHDALALLETGFPRSESEMQSRFKILSRSLKEGTCELTLQPKSPSARKMMPQIKLAFATNNFSLRATELQFADGSSMRNDFTNGVVNSKVDEKRFTPEIGSDYKIVEPLRK